MKQVSLLSWYVSLKTLHTLSPLMGGDISQSVPRSIGSTCFIVSFPTFCILLNMQRRCFLILILCAGVSFENLLLFFAPLSSVDFEGLCETILSFMLDYFCFVILK